MTWFVLMFCSEFMRRKDFSLRRFYFVWFCLDSHKNEVVLQDDCYHINPGSITGAYSSLTPDVTPSFILLAIQESKLVCYVYELVSGEVEVSKTEFTKSSPEASPELIQSLLS